MFSRKELTFLLQVFVGAACMHFIGEALAQYLPEYFTYERVLGE